MTKKETLWEDSGFDCHHCGGEIYKRIERESGASKKTTYQCRQCHCLWSTEGVLLEVGNMADCRSGRQTAVSRTRPTPTAPVIEKPSMPTHWLSNRIIAGLLLLIAGLLLIRFAGAVVFRFFVPALLFGLILYLVIQLGRQLRWW